MILVFFTSGDNTFTQKTDRNGQIITYLYDALNRLSWVTRNEANSGSPKLDFTGEELQVKFLADSEENSLKY